MNSIIEQILHNIGHLLDSCEAFLAPILPGQGIAALIAFFFYVLLLLGGGLTAVLARNLVRAMLGLVITFLGVAGMYLLLASPFLALMQLLIYIGAVCVLIFFAIMLTKNTTDGEETRCPNPINVLYAFLAALAPIVVAGPIIYLQTQTDPLQVQKIPVHTPVDSGANLGEGLLSMDLLPFELISIILLVAMAGAVFLAFKPQRSPNS
ncbi:MAG: NADH-quinone oxidoreductase subunit J [Deltaproteobacteria bacterium]|jgi:NADH-quinone oxidoreductase subunit J|nr:NADH-quinone oxidoreductase subunit J [Deltaproteobacteria bacterium]